MENYKLNVNNCYHNDWVIFDGRYFKVDITDPVFPCLQTIEFGIGVVDWNNIQPIPLSPELMERIEGWVKCKDNSSYAISYTNEVFTIRFYKGKFWRILYKDVTLDNIEGHLHQLQQLIRLFTNKEIEVKWEK